MSDSMHTHTPRAEFRAMLEDEVVRAYQRESRFTPRRWQLAPRQMRGIALVLVGLVMGFTTEFASGQVQDAQARNRLLQAATESRHLMAMRLDLAEEALRDAQRRYDVGVIGRESLLAAESEVRAMRMRFMRVESEIAEIRASSAPARDELWAPLVGGRDFVSDRLKLDASTQQDRLTTAERRLEELQRGRRLGAVSEGAVLEAEVEVAEARRELELAATKLQLRERFLAEKLTPDEVARRYQEIELMTEAKLAMSKLRNVEQRLAVARERARVGAEGELAVKRAEVEVLELQLRVRAIQQQLEKLKLIRK